MTKKIICMLLCLVMVFSLAACGGKNDTKPTDPSTEPTVDVTEPSEDATNPTEDTQTVEKLSSTLSLTTDVSKYVTLGEYKGIEYVLAQWSVSDDDVQKALETAFPEYPQVTEGKVKDGDNVNITFIGYIDGKEDPNCTYDEEGGYNLTIGSDAMIDGFEDGIIGQEIGKEFELKLKFPTENYHEDYLGKDVTFKITVHYVTGAAVYPELTDALIEEKTNGEYKTVDAYKAKVREDMEASAKSEADSKNITAVMDAIVANATFAELPAEEIEFYNNYVLSQNQSYANMFGMSLDEWLQTMMGTTVADFAEYNKEAAENYVKHKMVLIAIAQAENKTMSDEDFDKRLGADMEAYGYTALEEFKKAIEENDSLENWKTSYVLNDLEGWLVEQGVATDGTASPDATEPTENTEATN